MAPTEKMQNAIGDAVVSGAKKSLKKDWEENKKTYISYAVGAIACIAGINILFNVINRPRATRCNVHFYIHIN